MKKSCFALMTAAIALSSCTNTDVIDESGYNATSAIGFNTLVSKNARAIENTNFTKFFVFGTYKQLTASQLITVFNGTEVTKTDNVWGYDDLRFWVPGAQYTFAAYGVDNDALPEGCRANLGANDGVLNLNGFLSDGNNQRDLVYAKTTTITGKESNNDVVSFDFKHILSKLNFVFKSGFPAGFDVKVSNVRLHNVRNIGNFMGKDLVWEEVSRKPENNVPDIKPTYEQNIVSAVNGTEEEKTITSEWVYVIPFSYEAKNVDILFDIDVTNAGQPVLGKNNLKGTWAPKWEKNNSYTYTITINGDAAGLEPIEFAGTVSEWVTGTPAVPEFNLSGGEVPSEE